MAGYKVSPEPQGDNVNDTEFREQERRDEQDKIDNGIKRILSFRRGLYLQLPNIFDQLQPRH